MSTDLEAQFGDTFRDVLAAVTAYLHTSDLDKPDSSDPVYGLIDDVVARGTEHTTPIFVGLIASLVTELADATGTTRDQVWQDRASYYATAVEFKENPS